MTKFIFSHVALLITNLLLAQLPVINLPEIIAPQQFVYLSPTGNDANPGTMALPKKTFFSALNKIDFGIPGINNGQHYGEVVLLPGDYYPKATSPFVQNESQWRKNINGYFGYKNISISGIGNVILHGDSLGQSSQMIYLSGSKIKLHNLKIQNVPLHGIFCQGSAIIHHSDVSIDSVIVDGAIDFGILITGYTRILVEHSTVANTCLRNEHEKDLLCQWASGLRADNCSNVTFRNNRVYHNWGEGINTSLSEYVHVHDNLVFDNYSVNIYAHSASKAIYSHNLVYNIDSIYWRYCYNGKGFSSGISIANELTCTNACFLWSNSCGSLMSCCSETDYDHPILTFVNYKQVDSVFVFNNILLGSDISVWDAFSSFTSYANLSNIFIANNTSINVFGSNDAAKALLSIILGTPFVNYKNMNIQSNIFSVDLSIPKTSVFSAAAPNGICNGDWLTKFKNNGNLWSEIPVIAGFDFSKDKEQIFLPKMIQANEIDKLIPGNDHPELMYSSQLLDFINDDYFHNPRKFFTNSGAIENSSVTETENTLITKLSIIISPNPVSNVANIITLKKISQVNIYDSTGKLFFKTKNKIINCSNWCSGLYIIEIIDADGHISSMQVVKQ